MLLLRNRTASIRSVIALLCLCGVLLAPMVCQSRVAEQFGESLAEMGGPATLESELADECDACLAMHAPDQPIPVDSVAWDLVLFSAEVLRVLDRSAAELHAVAISSPHVTSAARQSMLQVYRC